MGKWFKLGSPIMLLWKSSKLTGARNSMLSVGLGLAFDRFPTLVDRRLKLLVESIVESTEEFPE
jgi:hypothetical protein